MDEDSLHGHPIYLQQTLQGFRPIFLAFSNDIAIT
jgi:hypothetical protein